MKTKMYVPPSRTMSEQECEKWVGICLQDIGDYLYNNEPDVAIQCVDSILRPVLVRLDQLRQEEES